jgi:hypothetical protein
VAQRELPGALVDVGRQDVPQWTKKGRTERAGIRWRRCSPPHPQCVGRPALDIALAQQADAAAHLVRQQDPLAKVPLAQRGGDAERQLGQHGRLEDTLRSHQRHALALETEAPD